MAIPGGFGVPLRAHAPGGSTARSAYAPRVRVICTAGHVDHGKSSLVRALTGMEPDRFEEERRRGLTIDVGFAWTVLAGDGPEDARTIAFVDLPGHERFIGNMLAGAGPVEAALFVVAADEGWMPQSQEHLDILELLGVRRAVVALSRADLVDEDLLDLSTALLEEQLEGTALAGAPIVATSATTGRGLPDLEDALRLLVVDGPAPADTGRPRLWVDRAFTVQGAGTVVTGTLAGGSLEVGQEVAVAPSGAEGRIRRLQALRVAHQRVGPGSRVAVNLAGVPLAAVGRGDAVGLPGAWLASRRVDVALRALPGRTIARRGAWKVHVGSAERPVSVLPLDGDALDAEGFASLELAAPLALQAGDRLVLRESGAGRTVGGGVVLDADDPRPARGRGRRAARAVELRARTDALAAGDRAALLRVHLASRGPLEGGRAAAAVGLTTAAARSAVEEGHVVALGPTLASSGTVNGWVGATVAALEAHHAVHAVARGAPRDVAERAARAAGCPQALVASLLDLAIRRGAIVHEGGLLRSRDHRATLDDVQAGARDRLLAALRADPFSPPGLAAAAAAAGVGPPLLRALEDQGAVVRLAPDLAVAPEALEEATARLRRAAADDDGTITAARAKDALGTTRKYALPLLEELDRRGVTVRRGDVREVR